MENCGEIGYLNLLNNIIANGTSKKDRTGTGTKSLFGYQLRFNLNDGFPLLTTKKLHIKSIIHELLWFLKGSTNNNELKENGVSIWNEWAKENGDLGPIYGYQWRNFGRIEKNYKSNYNNQEFNIIQRDGVDQISQVIDEIKNNPYSRRLIVSAWNPVDLPQMALAPCHALFQFNVRTHQPRFLDQDEWIDVGEPYDVLDCQLYQRSADVFLRSAF